MNRGELLKTIQSILTPAEIKYLNKECFFANTLKEIILESDCICHELVGALRWLSKYGDASLCGKLYLIIDECIKGESPYTYFNYWELRVEIYWKNKDLLNAKRYCLSVIGISKNVSDYIKNELKNPNWLRSNAYNRMAMILTKEKEFEQLIKLCEKAKFEGWEGDWDKRIDGAKKKLEKQKGGKP